MPINHNPLIKATAVARWLTESVSYTSLDLGELEVGDVLEVLGFD